MIVAGFHLPVMPFVDVSGNAGAVAFRQSCPIASKTGTIASDIVSTSVMLCSHSPFTNVYRYSPLSVYVSALRSHVNDPQAVAVVSVCTPVVISRFSVMLSSHSPFIKVYRYSPLSVYVSPLRSQVNDP